MAIHEIPIITLVIGTHGDSEVIRQLAVVRCFCRKLAVTSTAYRQVSTLKSERRQRVEIHYSPNGISSVECSLGTSENLYALNILKLKIECRRIKAGHIIHVHAYRLRSQSCSDTTDVDGSRDFGAVRRDKEVGDK